jgi:hypothetical protein
MWASILVQITGAVITGVMLLGTENWGRLIFASLGGWAFLILVLLFNMRPPRP